MERATAELDSALDEALSARPPRFRLRERYARMFCASFLESFRETSERMMPTYVLLSTLLLIYIAFWK